MAVAQLLSFQPWRKPEALSLQARMYKSLAKDLHGSRVTDEIMLAITLVGWSSCWFEATSLGNEHHLGARRLLLQWLTTRRPLVQASAGTVDYQFLVRGLIFWEMVSSFMMDESSGIVELIEHPDSKKKSPGLRELVVDPPGESSLIAVDASSMIIPHPWTGVSTGLFYLFAKVGRLLRTEVKRIRSHGWNTLAYANGECRCDEDEGLARSHALSQASDLEIQLLNYELPRADAIHPTGDVSTTVGDLIDLAKSHHLAAMLQLYRVFPELLERRLPLIQSQNAVDGGDNRDLWGTRPARDDLSQTSSREGFLFSLAGRILRMLLKLSPASSSLHGWGIVLLIGANELHLDREYLQQGRDQSPAECFEQPSPERHVNDTLGSYSSDDSSPSRENRMPETPLGAEHNSEGLDDEMASLTRTPVLDLRSLIWNTLSHQRHTIGLSGVQRGQATVRELWRRMDAGDPHAFWLEIMYDNHWETMLA
ncbi:hypothetical protein A1O1_08772 [Capronia coronata CBS 617.96]|uniref:Transcription factor domain-containing protein n=1 Tax=Capronia coronata CBS 617.96 TaxID=1182541 RepID=W9XH15_9EURO|nr:uncharacterized protein A1O1_08772 [Capronia coronata CBS 617.96]EXJ79508.1 hypothetical protein A1O1_08772 [Capronia coronata CBS 617.96]